MPLNDAKTLEGMKGWDVDLKFGKHFEEMIDDIFTGKHKAEIKTERDQWVGYGNLAIELEHNGKPSGLTRTESDVWIHNLAFKGKLMGSFLIPVDVLRSITEKMIEDKVARVTKGGDGWKSKLALLPINRILEYVQKECKND